MTKMQTITDAPKPSQVSELKSILGLVNYYAQFDNYPCTLYKLLDNIQSWQ